MTVRTCPNCGAPERRWLEHGKSMVNLDPITGNCVDCLREYAKEQKQHAPVSLPFDARAAAANDQGEA